MPFLPGLAAMPTTLLNAALGATGDRGLVVRGPDRLAVVSPMFDEEAGAGPALRSLLDQWYPVDEIAVSINGGTDRTAEVVAATLADAGYALEAAPPFHALGARLERWWHPDGGPVVTVLEHAVPTSKADGVNALVEGGYVDAERILIVDGDTRFDPAFVGRLRDAFYRLRVERHEGRRRLVLEDVALQSGAVDSLRPGPGRPLAGLISRARSGEYGIAALLRRGQTRRVGRGRIFGSSRLFTAVGCGFAARRDAFPMPSGSMTEDHDFTLRIQAAPLQEGTTDPATLDRRGFRVVVDGRERSPLELLDREDTIVVRRTSDARFVDDALMYTEDPTDLGGYVSQVQRWIGGGLENALERTVVPGAWRRARPNVRFTILAAQLENVLGLLLLAALPGALGLHVALPGGAGLAPAGLAVWLGVDLVATLLLMIAGLTRLELARGHRGTHLARRVAATAAGAVGPLLLFRGVNALCLLAAATRVVPAFLKRRALRPEDSGTWVRPRAAVRGVAHHGRFLTVTLAVLLLQVGTFEGVRQWAGHVWPDYRDAAPLVAAEPRVDPERHRVLPVFDASPAGRDAAPVPAQGWEALPRLAPAPPELPYDARAVLAALRTDEPAGGVSSFCRPDHVAASAPAPRRLGADAGPYVPLSPWGLLTLARLAPIAAHLEEAATAYDVAPERLLKVLLNESYLDPLAVGPTEDLGLSQVTSDALTMLQALSTRPGSPFANPYLFASSFSVFDPDFSICAGAAKLAWAGAQPGGEDEALAYARYINPLHGVTRGRPSERHAPLVAALDELTPLVDQLAATFAAHREDPARVTGPERALLAIVDDVAAGRLGLAAAYDRSAAIADAHAIDDAEFYEAVRTRLFGAQEEAWLEDVGPAASRAAGG